MERCKNCILPETYPGIKFTEKQVCHLCESYKKPEVKGGAALQSLLKSRKGEKYDCIVALSGGRDSTYVLHYATKMMGKVLALSYDNGFRHPQAQKNMEVACKKVCVELIQFKSSNNMNARVVAQALKTTIPQGPGAVSQLICKHCYTGGLSFIYSTAQEYNIPFVLWGDSFIELITFLPAKKKMFYKKPLRYLFSKHGFNFIRFLILLRKLRNEKLPEGNSRMDVRFPKLVSTDIQEIHLFDYIEWDRNEILSSITTSLGWEKPEDSVSTWRFDCYLHGLLNYCHKKAMGFNHDIDGLAHMVRAGKMTREEAMKLIEKGFDSDEWTSEFDHMVSKVIQLSDVEKEIMKSW